MIDLVVAMEKALSDRPSETMNAPGMKVPVRLLGVRVPLWEAVLHVLGALCEYAHGANYVTQTLESINGTDGMSSVDSKTGKDHAKGVGPIAKKWLSAFSKGPPARRLPLFFSFYVLDV